jgi:hypothetical protein
MGAFGTGTIANGQQHPRATQNIGKTNSGVILRDLKRLKTPLNLKVGKYL